MSKMIAGKQLVLRDGRMWIDGSHTFLKIGKPQRIFSDRSDIEQLIADLPIIRDKQYNCLELNCYWHHFDNIGNGDITVSLDPLNKLIEAIVAHGMYPCLSVETYAVGGGQIPENFWKLCPNAVAVDWKGQPVQDTEYGYMSAVPSLYSQEYLDRSRHFIRSLTGGLNHSNLLWFETTVEPQYMGSDWVDYSPTARASYHEWLESNDLAGPRMPDEFPMPESFLKDPTWNQFRAQWLADWVNGDAQAYRDVAGPESLIAIDYLDAIEDTMIRRCGDPLEFLRGLTAPNIVQVNWTWHNFERRPNQKAHDRVRQVMEETGRDWAITEHMTVNGCDYHQEDMQPLLLNTLHNGTRFGWEFVDIAPDRDPVELAPNHVTPGNYKPAHFGVYDADWKPKPHMAVVEDRWDVWLETAQACCELDAAAK